jgi:hypothetical protein
MRNLAYGIYPAQQASFKGVRVHGRSIIVDATATNYTETTEYDPSYLNFKRVATGNPEIEKPLIKIAMAALRAAMGHSPVLVRVRLFLYAPAQGLTSDIHGHVQGLFRLLTVPDWADADYRYRDVSGVIAWGGDAAIYSPVPGIDHHPVPFAILTIPANPATPPQWWSLDVTDEIAYHLAAGDDMSFMAAMHPIKTFAATQNTLQVNWKGDTAHYPYLSFQYLLPIEFYACKANGDIDLSQMLDNSIDLDTGNLYLGAVERGETGTPVACRIKNLGGRTLAHLEVWDDSPEWSTPVADAGNAGSGVLAHVVLAEASVSQKYTVKFTSATAYQVKAEAYKDNASNLHPTFGNSGWAGDTSADWNAPSGGLTIPTAAWSGTPQANDLIYVYVSGQTTDAAWPSDSNTQVEMTKDAAGDPDDTAWRPIKGQRTYTSGSVTIDAATKTINVRYIDTSKFPANTKVFIANGDTIDEGYIQSCTSSSITVVFGTVTNNVYAAGDKVCTTLPFRALGTAIFSTSTGAAGASQGNPALIPLLNAQSLGFANSAKILIRDVDDPTISEEATILAVDNVKITCAALLTHDYVSGSLVMQAGSGEGKFWLRIQADPSTTEELKRLRLCVRT